MSTTEADEVAASIDSLPDYVENIKVLNVSAGRRGLLLVLMDVWYKGTNGRECHHPNFLLPANVVLAHGSLILDLVDSPTRNVVWRLRGMTQAVKTKKSSPFEVVET